MCSTNFFSTIKSKFVPCKYNKIYKKERERKKKEKKRKKREGEKKMIVILK